MSADCVGTGCKAESLLKRIAELEAELEANLQQRVRMQHTINQYESGDKVSKYYACPDCAALRKRIEGAPVVAFESSVSGDLTRKCYEDSDIELIRKEDLK